MSNEELLKYMFILTGAIILGMVFMWYDITKMLASISNRVIDIHDDLDEPRTYTYHYYIELKDMKDNRVINGIDGTITLDKEVDVYQNILDIGAKKCHNTTNIPIIKSISII